MNEVISMTKKAGLKGCVLFSGLNDVELERIAALAVEKEHAPGATILKEGDSAREIFVLLEGRVALQTTLVGPSSPVGRRMTVDIVAENEALGWSALVEPYLYTMTGICLQKTTALAINANSLRSFLNDQPHVGFQVMKGLTRVIASRLEDTRQVLISERMQSNHGEHSGVRIAGA